MKHINCGICMDLIPLVLDGVASEESTLAVKAHLEKCSTCAEVFSGEIPESNSDAVLSKTLRRLQWIFRIITGLIVLIGVVLCELVMQMSSAVFLLVVFLVSKCLRVTFAPGKGHFLKRSITLLLALLLIYGTLWVGNEVFGNPVEKNRAEIYVQGYMEGKYSETDYYIVKIQHNMSAGSYEAKIGSQTDSDFSFWIVYRDGKLLYDTYEEVVNGIVD